MAQADHPNMDFGSIDDSYSGLEEPMIDFNPALDELPPSPDGPWEDTTTTKVSTEDETCLEKVKQAIDENDGMWSKHKAHILEQNNQASQKILMESVWVCPFEQPIEPPAEPPNPMLDDIDTERISQYYKLHLQNGLNKFANMTNKVLFQLQVWPKETIGPTIIKMIHGSSQS